MTSNKNLYELPSDNTNFKERTKDAFASLGSLENMHQNKRKAYEHDYSDDSNEIMPNVIKHQPDFLANPNKWKKYSLEDVDETKMNTKANYQAAMECLKKSTDESIEQVAVLEYNRKIDKPLETSLGDEGNDTDSVQEIENADDADFKRRNLPSRLNVRKKDTDEDDDEDIIYEGCTTRASSNSEDDSNHTDDDDDDDDDEDNDDDDDEDDVSENEINLISDDDEDEKSSLINEIQNGTDFADDNNLNTDTDDTNESLEND
jgi:hypothetical protein